MVTEKNPVSVNWQTLFIFLPLVWTFALYRIEKLRRGLLYFIPLTFVTTIFSGVFIGMPDEGDSPLGVLLLILIGVGIIISGYVIMIKLIRKWSREWNEKISKNS